MGQVGTGIGDRGMVLPQPLDQAGHRLAEQGLGLGISAPDIEEVGDGVEARSGLRMVVSQPFPADLQQVATERLGLGNPPLLHGRRGLLVELARGRHRLAALLGGRRSSAGSRRRSTRLRSASGRLQALLIDREALPGRLDRLGNLPARRSCSTVLSSDSTFLASSPASTFGGVGVAGRGFLGREVAADQGDRGRREDESPGMARRCDVMTWPFINGSCPGGCLRHGLLGRLDLEEDRQAAHSGRGRP